MPFRLRFEFRYVFAFCLACFAGNISVAQNEFLATLNYNNLNVNRIANIPNVTWINGNTTYDQNHQRFFFQGNSTNGPPWTLFTVDAVTGTVIYKVICSAGGNQGQVNGLEYDNVQDILYAIYFFNGLAQFAKIDPPTGNVTIISNIPPYQGFTESAYNSKDHLYIVSNGNSLLGIDANTGLIKNNLTGLAISNIKFDNVTGKLYGVKLSPILPNPQFDSVSLSTGTLHPIADLPPLLLPQIGAYTIDESAGKYIFVGTDADPACVRNYLYVLDINNGAILARVPYPYAKATGVIDYENVIDYSMDNAKGILYALNWRPPNAPILLTTAITASGNPVCAGNPVTFTATTGAQLVNPVYQWQLNGNDVGSNSVTYTNNNPANGDAVRCIMINNDPCLASHPDTSNTIVLTVSTTSPGISISSSASTMCSADTVVFTASSTDGGNAPVYQWQLNGVNIGNNANILRCTGLNNGDIVHCILTGSPLCNSPVVSNEIIMAVNQSPAVFIGNDTVIAPGNSIALNPSVSGTDLSYQWTPSTYLNDPSIINPVFTAGNTTTYQLLATADNGCTASAKITIIVYRDLRMPNAFTPNGDGKNDVFRIPASTSPSIKSFSIYNRWGQIIFHTSNVGAGWDGSFNGQQQPSGTYIWIIEFENPLTKIQEKRNGTVVLIR